MFPVTLTGPRVTLRELTVDDAEQLAEHAAHPRVFAMLDEDDVPTVDQMRDSLLLRVDAARRPQRLNYELGVEVAGELLGFCSLFDIRARPDSAMLAYALAFPAWGKGLATEAGQLLIRFGFTELGLYRIWATTAPTNDASQRVLQKLGMRKEGHLRRDKIIRGMRRDSILYAALADDPPG
jgi:RimJ/RimL family protein N-acetyltransferase